MKVCLITTCQAEVSGRNRICRWHWAMVPGKLRSTLSLAACTTRSAVTDDIWDKARRAVEQREVRA
jgi:hypothetical protein